ncbi:MAG TPA: ABC transporter permease [Actinoplanes sp.]|nr:ABC transporter permease [Actinoplanes sp.]
MNAALTIAGKDVRQRLRDRSAILMALVLPLALAFLFNLLFGSAAAPRPFRYAVVDLDRGPIAQAFRTDVLDPLQRDGVVELRAATSAQEGERLADSGAVDAVFVLPAGFSAAAQSDRPASLEVIGSVDAPTGTDVARSIAGSYAADLTSVRLAVTAALGDGHDGEVPAQQLATLAARAVAAERPVAVQDVSAAAKLLDSATFFPASMAVFFLFFSVQLGVASLLDERSDGTLRRLLAAPVPASAVLVGKLLTSVIIGVVSTTVLVVASAVLMGAHWGNPAGVGLLVVAGVLAATGVTALVASLAGNAEQAGSWGAVVAVLLGLLGGVFVPVAQVGGVVATMSLVTPHAWFLRGLGELQGGAGPQSVLPAAGAMLAFAVVTFGVAMLRLRKVLRP